MLHPRNPHTGRYDFKALLADCPELEKFLRQKPNGDKAIDFADPAAVLMLNRALLAHHYDIEGWSIPEGYPSPSVPERADYIHYLADLVGEKKTTRVLDVGTGANCIYPIIGCRSYDWKFTASEIDPRAVESAQKIVEKNNTLDVEIKHQENDHRFFESIIGRGEHFHLTLCNPPFHMDAQEAQQGGSGRKVVNLAGRKGPRTRHSGVPSNGLWCQGGELRFISQMIEESAQFGNQVGWFTCIVARADHLVPLKRKLAGISTAETRVIEMGRGKARSRFIAWRF